VERVRPTPAQMTATTARTVALDTTPDLLALLPDARPVAWVRDSDGLVGWGEVARFSATGPGRFSDLEAQWRQWLDGVEVDDPIGRPGTGPVTFGAFTYAPGATGSTLVVPRVVVGRRDGYAWLTTIGEQGATLGPVRAALPPEGLRYADGAQPSTRWTATVAEAVRQIRAGRLDKVVLARDVLASADDDVDPRFLLIRLAARYAEQCWTFAVDGIVGATPELLVRRTGAAVTSRVLAGTIRRGRDDAEDAELAAWLAASGKNLAEHAYAVRSLTDSLAADCADVRAPEAPEVLALANVSHLSSVVHAHTTDGATALQLAGALHPTAAVGGTPPDVAEQVIDELDRRPGRRRVGHRLALRRDRRPRGADVRRGRHRRRVRPRCRARRDTGQVRADPGRVGRVVRLTDDLTTDD